MIKHNKRDTFVPILPLLQKYQRFRGHLGQDAKNKVYNPQKLVNDLYLLTESPNFDP